MNKLPLLHDVLYPSNFKRWIAIPHTFPQEIQCQLRKKYIILIRKDYSDQNVPILNFYWYLNYMEQDDDDIMKRTWKVKICNLVLNTYLSGPFFVENKIHPEMKIDLIVGGKLFQTKPFVVGKKQSAYQIFQRNYRKDVDDRYDQGVLHTTDGKINAKLTFSGFDIEYLFDLGSVSILKQFQKENTPSYYKPFTEEPRWIWKKDQVEIDFTFENDGFLNANLFIDLYHPNIWTQVQKTLQKTFPTMSNSSPPSGLFMSWLPIELANEICDMTSAVVMNFYPLMFPNPDEQPLKRLVWVENVDTLYSKESFDFDLIRESFPEWKTESYSQSVVDYVNLETELQSLLDKHIVGLSEEEFARFETIVLQIKRLRKQGKDIQCQICFVAKPVFKTDANPYFNGIGVCKNCSKFF